MAFGVRKGACGTGTVADGRTESVCIEYIDEARESLDLDFRFRVARHVGSGEMREHPFELEMLEGKCRADVVKVFGVESVTVHARVDCEMCLAGRSCFAKELVKGYGCAEVRNRSRKLELDEVSKICRRARAEYEYRQVHAVLAKQHAFADMGDSQIVRTAEFSGE